MTRENHACLEPKINHKLRIQQLKNHMPIDNLNMLDANPVQQTNDYISLQTTFPYRPTLFLGLGGTGCSAVAKIKNAYEKIFANQAGLRGVAGIPPMYAFRTFDTDATGLQPGLNAGLEFVHLGLADPKAFINGQGKKQFYQDWIAPHLTLNTLTNGANGYRNLGRLCITAHIDKFASSIDSAFRQITGGHPWLKNHDPVVYIFCSLSGGTGSGMLLDACFILARHHAAAKKVGMLGVLDGLPSVSVADRDKMRNGVFAAMKELNAFMTNTQGKGCPNGEDFIYPTNNTPGRYVEPFQHCYLVSSRDNKGQTTLGTQDKLTSFMSRCALAMSAYSFPSSPDEAVASPDFDGIMTNQKNQLEGNAEGAHTCYIVPSLTQMSFPLEEIVDWACCRSAADFLRYIRGGTGYQGDADARNFSDKHGLNLPDLEQTAFKNLDGTFIEERNYDREIEDKLKVGDGRGRDLIAYANGMLGVRLAEIQAQVRVNLESLQTGIKKALRSQVVTMLKTDKFMYAGAKDFLEDLRNILNTAQEALEVKSKSDVEPAYESIALRWDGLSKRVDEVVKAKGFLKKAYLGFQVEECQKRFATFLRDAEHATLQKARTSEVRAFLASLVIEINETLSRLRKLYEETLSGVLEVVDKRASTIAGQLNALALGQGNKVEDVCSVSLVSQQMREKLLEKHATEVGPSAMLGNLCHTDWDPLLWLDMSGKAADGTPQERVVAQDLVSRVAEFFKGWRKWDVGALLAQTQDLRGQSPLQYFDKMLLGGQAQMYLSDMLNSLGRTTHATYVVAGVPDGLKQELMKLPRFVAGNESLNSAESYETQRVTIFGAHLPVAAAGLRDMREVFKQQYDVFIQGLSALRNREDKERELGLVHCFPKSAEWPDPTAISDTVRLKAMENFAKCLAISEILDVSPEDKVEMDRATTSPKSKKYAFFRVGRAAFWLWPFFQPLVNSSISTPPLKLGTNVFDSFNKFIKEQEFQKHASDWVNWFSENYSTYFTSPDAQQRLDGAKKALPSTDLAHPQEGPIWREVYAVLDAWGKTL